VADTVNNDRCACGEVSIAERAPGESTPYGHYPSNCRIGDTWVQRSTFEKPPLELVKAYLAEKALAERHSANLDLSRQNASDLAQQLQRALEDAAEWKAVATAQARIIAREVARG
jgi:hypothetical protein